MKKQPEKPLRPVRDDPEKYLNPDPDSPFPDRADTVSVQECTGLFPTPPQSAPEYESLQQMHGMEIPKEKP